MIQSVNITSHFDKIIRVIESCIFPQQLEYNDKIISNFAQTWEKHEDMPTMEKYLQNKFQTKLQELYYDPS